MLFKYKEGSAIDAQVFINPTLFPNQRLVKSSKNDQIYYIQNNRKHPIKNKRAFADYYFDQNQIVLVTDNFLSQLPENLTIHEINKTDLLPDGIVYSVQTNYYISLNNYLHPIEKDVVIKLKLPVLQSVKIDTNIIKKFKQGDPISWGIK